MISPLPVTVCQEQDAVSKLTAERDRLSMEGKHAEALEVAEKAVEVLRTGAPGSSKLVEALFAAGRLAHRLGRLERAEALCGEALAIFKRIAPGSLGVAAILSSLGNVALDHGDLDLAQKRHEEALGITERLAPESLNFAICLNNLGNVARERGDLDTAQKRYEESLKIKEQLAPDSLTVASSLVGLGNLALERGDLPLAQKRLEAALASFQRLAPGSVDAAKCLNNLGTVARELGDLDIAQKRFEDALAHFQRLAPNSIDAATCLANLGMVAKDRGDLALAQKRHEEALAIRQRLAPDSLSVAASHQGLGSVALDCGDLDLAQMHYEQALAILQRLAPGSLGAATCLGNLGTVARYRGDLDLAQRRMEEELAICHRLAPDSPSAATTLLKLGLVAHDRGDLDLAQRHYEAALTSFRRLAADSLDVAAGLVNLGVIAYDRGDPGLAQKRFEEALGIYSQLSPGSQKVAASLIALGNASLALGDPGLAQKRYEEALEIFSRLSPSSLQMGLCLNNLTVVGLHQGKDPGPLLERRLSLAESLLSTQGAAMTADLGAYGDLATSALFDLGWLQDPSTQYRHVPSLRGAGLALESRVAAAWRRAESDSEVSKVFSDAQMAAVAETDWASSPRPDGMAEQDWNSKLLDLRAKRRGAEAALVRLLKKKDSRLAQGTLAVDPSEVQAAIPEGSVLVEYLRVSTWDRQKKDQGPDAYAAFVVSRSSPVRYLRLAPAQEVDSLVREWQSLASPGARGEVLGRAYGPEAVQVPGKDIEARLKETGRRLHRLLVEPLGSLPENLLVAPDSTLHALPFAALVDARGRYLLETKSLSLVGSGRDLVEEPSSMDPGPPAVVCGPDFGLGVEAAKAAPRTAEPPTRSYRSESARGTWGALPGALAEGREVASLLGVEPVEGAAATEERLLSLVRPRVLHIATHGFFFPPRETRAKRDGMIEPAGGIRSSDSPMLRSGLVLAGADNGDALRSAGLSDGWATALEISQMDLRGTELAVLSACDTGLGETRGADGVFGLQRALRFAGAQSVLMSLFKVPDESTRLLMGRFYKAWKPGHPKGSKAVALRDAQLALLKDPKTKSPRNWAAFVLLGDR